MLNTVVTKPAASSAARPIVTKLHTPLSLYMMHMLYISTSPPMFVLAKLPIGKHAHTSIVIAANER
jgi:hypothetical protein